MPLHPSARFSPLEQQSSPDCCVPFNKKKKAMSRQDQLETPQCSAHLSYFDSHFKAPAARSKKSTFLRHTGGGVSASGTLRLFLDSGLEISWDDLCRSFSLTSMSDNPVLDFFLTRSSG
mmetsp:Transcript_2560/g.7615  ORF Transcript_2560/g.7615 Transcript_2560/m.7615 type:complete len:119 (+) Transcript_2560:96-452(+)